MLEEMFAFLRIVFRLTPIASTITIVPNNLPMETDRPSVRHFTTAIEDDDDELFSTSRRKMPIAQVRTPY